MSSQFTSVGFRRTYSIPRKFPRQSLRLMAKRAKLDVDNAFSCKDDFDAFKLDLYKSNLRNSTLYPIISPAFGRALFQYVISLYLMIFNIL